MLSDRFWEHGMKYIAEIFQYRPPEYQQVAWRASLDEKHVTDEAFGKAVKFIGGSLKQWNQTTNLSALVVEYVDDVYRPEQRVKAINAQRETPKQLPPPRDESRSLVEFHHFAMARFEAMRAGELPRNPGESVRDHCSRMQAKILSECRINGNPAPRQYAEAWT